MIDAHTHFFSEEAAIDTQAWAQKRGETYWDMLVGKRPDGKLSLQGFPSEEKFLSDMDKAGVEHAVIQGWYWQNHETCVEENNRISALIKRYPDRLSAFASISPAFPQSVDIAKSARDMGFCGLGELHDGVQNFSYKSLIFEKLMNVASDQKLAVNIHITEQTQRTYLGKTDTATNDAIEVANIHKDVIFIFAHWCGNKAFENLPELDAKNIYFDSAATQFTAPKNAFELAEKNAILSKKIIYGTDYPLRLYPRMFKEEEMLTALTFAKNSVSKNFAKILFTNNYTNIIKSV